jgi:hypothetical protein
MEMILRALAINRIVRGALVLALVGTACGAQVGAPGDARISGTAPPPTGTAGRQFDFHSDRVDLDTPSAMCRAIFVEVATVRGFGPSRWNTSGGAAPTGDLDKAVRLLGYRIYTPITRSETKALVDHRTTAAAEYVSHGGRVGGVGISDDAYPEPRMGSRYVLVFVPTIQGGIDRIDTSVLVAHNAFLVLSGDRVQLKRQVMEQGRITQQEVTIPLSDLVAQLSKC